MTRRISCQLMNMLAKLEDPRKNIGRRHPLKSILALIVIGLMCGHKGYTSIATWHDLNQNSQKPSDGHTRKHLVLQLFIIY